MRRAVALVFVLILVGALAAPLTTARPSWFCERRPTHPSCAPATPTPSPTWSGARMLMPCFGSVTHHACVGGSGTTLIDDAYSS